MTGPCCDGQPALLLPTPQPQHGQTAAPSQALRPPHRDMGHRAGGTTSKGGRRSGTAPPLPPVPQSSSSVPSMQSASASQRQRMGMQCPFLHWNWSNSQRGVQSFCSGKAGDSGQQGQPPPWQAPAPLLQPGAGPQTPALQVLGLPRNVRGTSGRGRSGGCGPAPTCRQGGGGAGREPPSPQHRTSSEPSAQSWSPSHFHLPAMQRPLAHENSLSEQGRGAGGRQEGGDP